jgi:glycosyltransferase involved in cell wall biosynthesis
MSFKPCVVVPVYDHERAVGATLERLAASGLTVFVVDDGSHEACARLLQTLAARAPQRLRLLRHPENRGKGAAVRTGIEAAAAASFTHAVQVDADGQHDLADLPHLLALAQRHPQALVSGIPLFDESIPKARLYGRYVTHVWVWINTLSLQIRDSMCGFRVYPIGSALAVWREEPVSRRMAFDTDIMVRLHWRGVPVVGLPTRVRYPLDGVSHFDLVRDNLRISGMHARLFLGMLLRLPLLLLRKLRPRAAARAS